MRFARPPSPGITRVNDRSASGRARRLPASRNGPGARSFFRVGEVERLHPVGARIVHGNSEVEHADAEQGGREKRGVGGDVGHVARGLAADPGPRVGNRKRPRRRAERGQLEQEAPAPAARRPLQGDVAPLPLFLEVDGRKGSRRVRRGGRRAGRVDGGCPFLDDEHRIAIDLHARRRAWSERRVRRGRSRRGRSVRRLGRGHDGRPGRRDREQCRREQKRRERCSLGAIRGHALTRPAPAGWRLSQGNAALPSTRKRTAFEPTCWRDGIAPSASVAGTDPKTTPCATFVRVS